MLTATVLLTTKNGYRSSPKTWVCYQISFTVRPLQGETIQFDHGPDSFSIPVLHIIHRPRYSDVLVTSTLDWQPNETLLKEVGFRSIKGRKDLEVLTSPDGIRTRF